jgi:hypothetical protein
MRKHQIAVAMPTYDKTRSEAVEVTATSWDRTVADQLGRGRNGGHVNGT